MRLVAFALVAGAGVQAWRNFPPDGPFTTGPAMLAMVLAVVCAFLGGYRLGRPSAHASASAYAAAQASAASSARAQNTVNLAVVVPGQGAGSSLGVRVPGEDVSWLAGGDRRQITADDLDGMDLSEFSESHELEGHDA